MSASRKRSSHQQESDMAMVQTHVFTTKPSSLVWIASLIALMNAWSVGLVIGFFSAGMQSLMDANPQIGWDKEGHMSSWVGGSMALGGLVGSLVAGPVLSKLGPRNSTIAANVPFFIGWIMLMFGKSLFVLIVARLLGGFALGFSSGAVPVYCIEISTPNIRGILGACFQVRFPFVEKLLQTFITCLSAALCECWYPLGIIFWLLAGVQTTYLCLSGNLCHRTNFDAIHARESLIPFGETWSNGKSPNHQYPPSTSISRFKS